MNVDVNYNSVQEQAENITSAADCFYAKDLFSKASTTTISARRNMMDSYDMSQRQIDLFGEKFATDADRISKFGLKFEEYDKMLAEMAKNN